MKNLLVILGLITASIIAMDAPKQMAGPVQEVSKQQVNAILTNAFPIQIGEAKKVAKKILKLISIFDEKAKQQYLVVFNSKWKGYFPNREFVKLAWLKKNFKNYRKVASKIRLKTGRIPLSRTEKRLGLGRVPRVYLTPFGQEIPVITEEEEESDQ